jgi:hypothetical protein
MDKNKDTKKVKKKIFGILIYKRILKNIHPKMFLGMFNQNLVDQRQNNDFTSLHHSHF